MRKEALAAPNRRSALHGVSSYAFPSPCSPSRQRCVGREACHDRDFPAAREGPDSRIISASLGYNHTLRYLRPSLPSELAGALGPMVETIGSLTEKIKDYDRRIEELATEHYPETRLLRQVPGVGSLTALTFVLTLEDPRRFAK